MELKNDRLVEFSPRRGCWVVRMTRAEIDDACFARYLLESGAVFADAESDQEEEREEAS